MQDLLLENLSELLVLVVLDCQFETADHHVEMGHDQEIEHLLQHWDFHVAISVDCHSICFHGSWLEVSE